MVDQSSNSSVFSRSSSIKFSFLIFIFIADIVHECIMVNGERNCNPSDKEFASMSTHRPSNVLLETHRRILKYDGDSLTLPMKKLNGRHSVTLGLGTPTKTLTFALFNSMDVSWTQCQPCSCYDQLEPIFDPSNSSSYRGVSCSSALCTTECLDSEASCPYSYKDGNNSTIDGSLSTDVLSLSKKEIIPEFIFGCGTNNSIGESSQVAGYLGLGTGPMSFLATTEKKYNKRFSYCLPHGNSTGFLSFGGDGLLVASKNPQFVPFSEGGPADTTVSRTDYVLDMVGISVGGKSVTMKISMASPLPIILEPANYITRFPEEIYMDMRDEFRKRMSKYRLLPEESSSYMDTCFDISADKNPAVPTIEFTFSNGVRLPMASPGILYAFNSSVACFPFGIVDPGSLAFWGNIQQETIEIIFDNPNSRIGFGRNGCSTKESLQSIAVARTPALLYTLTALTLNLMVVVLLNVNMLYSMY